MVEQNDDHRARGWMVATYMATGRASEASNVSFRKMTANTDNRCLDVEWGQPKTSKDKPVRMVAAKDYRTCALHALACSFGDDKYAFQFKNSTTSDMVFPALKTVLIDRYTYEYMHRYRQRRAGGGGGGMATFSMPVTHR